MGKIYRTIDLFAGIGGIRLGFEAYGCIIRKSKFSRPLERSVQILGFCIKRSVQKSASAQQQKSNLKRLLF